MTQFTNRTPNDNASDVGRFQFVIRSALSGIRTSMPVEVLAVSNDGGVSPIGRVTIRPLVGAVDGNGVVWDHAEISNVPYLRAQGGSNAVILDPQVGDIGLASVCDRDISALKSSGAASAPGSSRRFDFSDAIYLLTIIGGTPTQYIQFTDGGINIVSPGTVSIQAAQINFVGPVSQSGGTLTAASEVNSPAVVASTSLSVAGNDVGSHVHGGVSTGTHDSGTMIG